MQIIKNGNRADNSGNEEIKDAEPQEIQKERRKFLFIDSAIGDLAWQVQKEGHEVKIYTLEGGGKRRDVVDGFIEKVEDWRGYVDWADTIVFGYTNYGMYADALRKRGKFVVGGSAYTDAIEKDREFGQTEMRAAGMNVLPHWDFTDFDLAVQFIRENPGRYVFKPSGGTLEKGILFIGREEDGKDITEVIEHNKKDWAKRIKKFQLQKFISGIEIAVGAFFNGTDFIYPINVNFEHKKLFPGDIGPYTGEMGTLMFWSSPNVMFQMTLVRMREKLRECKYVGYIDINCIANGKGIYPLEFTCRFGFPTISIQMEGVASNWGDFLHAIARGESFEFKTKRGFQVGIVIAVPPFPYGDKREASIYEEATIIFKKQNLEGIHLGDVKLVEDNWRLATSSGYALIVTSGDSTVEAARKQAYKRIDNILLQNMYYRTDIGVKWYKESDLLQTWGYLEPNNGNGIK